MISVRFGARYFVYWFVFSRQRTHMASTLKEKENTAMKPNAQQLALRDPALAAIVGAFALSSGANFGAEFGDDDYGEDPFGDDDYGAEFGDDMFGAAARPAPRAAMARVNPQAAMKLMQARNAAMARTAQRNQLLEPNKGSSIKVEKYVFTISQSITLGTAVAFTTLTGQPDTTIRPQRVSMNSPSVMFAFVQEIKVANVSVTVGSGLEDAYNYNANGVGQQLDMPTLSPANRATVLGSYTGYVPPGFVSGTATSFTVSFRGPASIVA